MNSCKCGSLDFYIEKQGNNTGLYCAMCGKWQKWMNKDEIRAFEHNHVAKKPNNDIDIETQMGRAIRTGKYDNLTISEFVKLFT